LASIYKGTDAFPVWVIAFGEECDPKKTLSNNTYPVRRNPLAGSDFWLGGGSLGDNRFMRNQKLWLIN